MSRSRFPNRRGLRSRRPGWRRQRWWIALGVYSLGLCLVLGVLAQRRWGQRPTGVDSVLTGGADMRRVSRTPAELSLGTMSPRSPGESLARGWTAERMQEAYLPAMGSGCGTEPRMSAPWLPQPGTSYDMERLQGPGWGDLKLVNFELPDLNHLGGL